MAKVIENFDDVKNQMLKSENGLASYACKSSYAVRFQENREDIRLEYAHDCDKIIHSLAYTRYLGKTQVYPLSQNDHVSNRMTHVQFVSRASRTIARALGLNEDLCEAIALGHDIGHVPFGHQGEYILNSISKKELEEIFSHNVQSVRNFMHIEKGGEGLNLSLQVLDGMLCHNGERVSNIYEPNKLKDKNAFLDEYNKCYTDEIVLKKLRPMTLEGCVVRISDIIGYLGKDIEDSVRLKTFERKSIPSRLVDILGDNNVDIMNNIILDIVENSFGKEYIAMSSEVYEAMAELKRFNYENIYFKSMSEEDHQKIETMFNELFYYYLKVVDSNKADSDIYKVFLNLKNDIYIQNTSNKRKVIDYMSGMTDTYMINMYEKNILQK